METQTPCTHTHTHSTKGYALPRVRDRAEIVKIVIVTLFPVVAVFVVDVAPTRPPAVISIDPGINHTIGVGIVHVVGGFRPELRHLTVAVGAAYCTATAHEQRHGHYTKGHTKLHVCLQVTEVTERTSLCFEDGESLTVFDENFETFLHAR